MMASFVDHLKHKSHSILKTHLEYSSLEEPEGNRAIKGLSL